MHIKRHPLPGLLLLIMLLVVIAPLATAAEQENTNLNLYLVRHGQTWSNIRHMTIGGGGNAPLTEKGRQDAFRVGLGISQIPLIAAYSSTLGRAVETANLIVQGREMPVTQIEALKDISWGDAEGGYIDDLTGQFGHSGNDFPFYFGHWNDAHFVSPVKAESMYQFAQRFEQALRKVIDRHKGQQGNLLLVAHSSLGFYLQKYRGDQPLTGLSNTSVSVLNYSNGRFSLKEFNNTDYLQRGLALEQNQPPFEIVLLDNPLTLLHNRAITEGMSDSEYSKAGAAANLKVKQKLRGMKIASAWSSTLRRARTMAGDTLPEDNMLSLRVDHRLDELFVGKYEAGKESDLPNSSGLRKGDNILQFTVSSGEAGENATAAADRLYRFLCNVTQQSLPSQGKILVYTHPMVIRAFAARYLPASAIKEGEGASMTTLTWRHGAFTLTSSEIIAP